MRPRSQSAWTSGIAVIPSKLAIVAPAIGAARSRRSAYSRNAHGWDRQDLDRRRRTERALPDLHTWQRRRGLPERRHTADRLAVRRGQRSTAQTALFLELGFIVPSDLEAGTAPLTGVFGGYLYLNLSIGRLAGARSPGLTPDAIDTQLYGTYGAPAVRPPAWRSEPVATARIVRGLVRTLRRPDVGYVDDVMRDAVAWVAAMPEVAASSDRVLLDLVPTFPARIEQLFVALLRASTMSGTGRGIAEELLKRGGDGIQLVNRLTSGLGTIDSALPCTAVVGSRPAGGRRPGAHGGLRRRCGGRWARASADCGPTRRPPSSASSNRSSPITAIGDPTSTSSRRRRGRLDRRSRSPPSIGSATPRPSVHHVSHRSAWRSNASRRSRKRCARSPGPSGRCCGEASRPPSSVPRHVSGRRTRSSASSRRCGRCSTSWRPAPRRVAVPPTAATATWSPPASSRSSCGTRSASST